MPAATPDDVISNAEQIGPTLNSIYPNELKGRSDSGGLLQRAGIGAIARLPALTNAPPR